jgi:hypothetical protein
MAIAAKYKPGHVYAVDGGTLNGLLTIASEIAESFDKGFVLRDDVLHDYGQWIQVRLDKLEELPSEPPDGVAS